MEENKTDVNEKTCDIKGNLRYSFSEDMAIVNYMINGNRYLKSSGIQVWKDAEKLQICAGRSYLSMKERFRKVIVKNLKNYNVEKNVALKITQFMRANDSGKSGGDQSEGKLKKFKGRIYDLKTYYSPQTAYLIYHNM